ncbi:hypothetical protein [Streptomyces lavendofoliae]|uniref:hypothetical protein n=1 Tax=Streptomyces lavendofoliae TaxID=67314 RepID=UPI003D8F3BEA
MIGIPAFDNTCVVHSVGNLTAGPAVSGSSLLGGNTGQALLDLPRNQCGGCQLLVLLYCVKAS